MAGDFSAVENLSEAGYSLLLGFVISGVCLRLWLWFFQLWCLQLLSQLFCLAWIGDFCRILK